MIFGTQARLSKLEDPPFSIYHNEMEISLTESYKYLGVHLTPSLNMNYHISETIKKASSRVCLLQKVRKYMDTKTSSLVYKTMVLPLFTYCSFCLYGSTPAYLKQRINFVESRAEKIIKSIVSRREEVLKKRICMFVHRCLFKSNTCGTFDDYFKFECHKIKARAPLLTYFKSRWVLFFRTVFKLRDVALIVTTTCQLTSLVFQRSFND